MPLIKSHWAIRYFFDKSRTIHWEGKSPRNPCFTRQAVEIVEDWIKLTDTVLEALHGMAAGAGGKRGLRLSNLRSGMKLSDAKSNWQTPSTKWA